MSVRVYICVCVCFVLTSILVLLVSTVRGKEKNQDALVQVRDGFFWLLFAAALVVC